jgi:PadR family transcriptional regulator, regulatory protein PadR
LHYLDVLGITPPTSAGVIIMKISRELIAASARPLLLSILSRGESYGYAIIQEVHRLSAGQFQWTEGMLYPVLHRLEAEGLIESRWESTDTSRKRKYYRLKKEGARVLKAERQSWLAVHNALVSLWETAHVRIQPE